MSVGDVKKAFARVVQDGKIDAKDVDTVLQSAGNISTDEEKALKKEADKYAGKFDPAAKTKLQEKLGEVSSLRRQAAEINSEISGYKPKLNAAAQERLAAGKTFGGSPIPESVKKLVNDSIKAGAVAYDVREMNPDPVYDSSHGDPEMTIEGKFNPYAQDQRAVDSMSFSHTELTPKKISDDMSTTQTWMEQDGYKTVNGNQEATFKKVTGKGSGNITALYDEATWPETMARGKGGQKYANNFAILADGSVHCVPASRRTAAEPWRILTTASLARGQNMLFNGHIGMTAGVVTYVGMSGRLCKLQEKGEAKFVDPIALLQAWGFKTAPGLKVSNEG